MIGPRRHLQVRSSWGCSVPAEAVLELSVSDSSHFIREKDPSFDSSPFLRLRSSSQPSVLAKRSGPCTTTSPAGLFRAARQQPSAVLAGGRRAGRRVLCVFLFCAFSARPGSGPRCGLLPARFLAHRLPPFLALASPPPPPPRAFSFRRVFFSVLRVQTGLSPGQALPFWPELVSPLLCGYSAVSQMSSLITPGCMSLKIPRLH